MTVQAEYALSTRKGYGTPVRLSFGLVQIPIRLHLVVDDTRSVPSRSMFTADGHPVGYQHYDKDTGEPVPTGAIDKRVEVDGVWVTLTDDEIEALSAGTPGMADITGFVPADQFDSHYLLERPAVWAPDTMKVGKRKVVDPAAAKAVALLSKAMTDRGVVALAFVPSRSGGQYVALFPDGRAGYVAYADNVRPMPEQPDVEVTADEVALADILIDSIGVGLPVLRDEVGEKIRSYLADKAADPSVAISPAPLDQPSAASLVETLMASLTARKEAS